MCLLVCFFFSSTKFIYIFSEIISCVYHSYWVKNLRLAQPIFCLIVPFFYQKVKIQVSWRFCKFFDVLKRFFLNLFQASVNFFYPQHLIVWFKYYILVISWNWNAFKLDVFGASKALMSLWLYKQDFITWIQIPII